MNCSTEFSLGVAELQRHFFLPLLVSHIISYSLFPFVYCTQILDVCGVDRKIDMSISAESVCISDLFGLGEHKTEVSDFNWNARMCLRCSYEY